MYFQFQWDFGLIRFGFFIWKPIFKINQIDNLVLNSSKLNRNTFFGFIEILVRLGQFETKVMNSFYKVLEAHHFLELFWCETTTLRYFCQNPTLLSISKFEIQFSHSINCIKKKKNLWHVWWSFDFFFLKNGISFLIISLYDF